MKKMSFVILVMSLACILISCTSLGSLEYPEPEFDKPSSYVIDALKVKGSYKDNIRLFNESSDSKMNFNVYLHHPGTHEWVFFGTGELKGKGDADTIDSKINHIDKYRYFAIEALNGKNYKYQITKDHNDLYITILDN
jgi:hypothetical protein